MRRFIACVLACALLASCTPRPDGSYDDHECRQVTLGDMFKGSSHPTDLIVVPIIYGIFFVSCETIAGLEVSWRYYHPLGPSDGFYLPPDRLFSVAIPRSAQDGGRFYTVRENIVPGQDSVLFTPTDPTEPVLTVVGLSKLQGLQASESVQAFAEEITPKLPDLAAQAGSLQQVYAEILDHDAGPAYLVVYKLVPAPGQEQHQAYQFLYFIKDKDDGSRAAVLSVTWPHECPDCVAGPEKAIRSMDPRIRNLVASFSFDTGHKP